MRQISEAESQAFEGFTKAAQQRLKSHHWPGNVRELKAVIRVAALLGADAPQLTLDHLPPDLAPDPSPAGARDTSLASVELEAVQRAIADHDGNVSAAARRLGIARSTVYRILRRADP